MSKTKTTHTARSHHAVSHTADAVKAALAGLTGQEQQRVKEAESALGDTQAEAIKDVKTAERLGLLNPNGSLTGEKKKVDPGTKAGAGAEAENGCGANGCNASTSPEGTKDVDDNASSNAIEDVDEDADDNDENGSF